MRAWPGADEDPTQAEDAGLRQHPEDLACRRVDPRHAALAAHAGEAAALLLALPLLLSDVARPLDGVAQRRTVGAEVAFEAARAEPLNGVPILPAASIAQHRRAAELDQARRGRAVSAMSGLAQQKCFSLGKISPSTALRKVSLFSVERHDSPKGALEPGGLSWNKPADAVSVG